MIELLVAATLAALRGRRAGLEPARPMGGLRGGQRG
jgi:hypothetical protein